MAAPSEPATGEAEHYRREAMGAFAHELRTPLTSIRMVLELAKRQSTGGETILDAELATMLNTSVDDLQRLADDLQETSRLERGRVILSAGPCDLGAAIEAAGELVGPHLAMASTVPAAIAGPWDAGRLVRAIAGFAQAANRIGDGSGTVNVAVEQGPGGVTLGFASGKPNGAAKAIAADAGFSFFRARQIVLAMGGSVECERFDRFVNIRVGLPLPPGYTP